MVVRSRGTVTGAGWARMIGVNAWGVGLRGLIINKNGGDLIGISVK